MDVYQIKFIPERFKAFQLDLLDLSKQLGKTKQLRELMRQPITNESWVDIWNGEIKGDFKKLSPKSTEIPDISWWYHNKLILTEKAHSVLKDYLQPDGEFLPVFSEGQKMHVFNCLSFAEEDKGLTEQKFLDGYEDGLKSLAFNEADIKPRMVFKSKMEGCNRLYAPQKLKDCCEEFGLEGLRFDANLIDPF